MFSSRLVLLVTTFTVFGLANGLVIRQDSQGKPISVGLAANRTQEAASVFGTTTSSPNFLTMPTSLCIVPVHANEAGLGHDKKVLIVQQALEICPRAQRIAVSED